MNYRGIVLGVIVVIGIVLVVLTQKDRDGQGRRAIVGLEAPEFTLVDKNGTEMKLSQFKGKLYSFISGRPGARNVKKRCLIYRHFMTERKMIRTMSSSP